MTQRRRNLEDLRAEAETRRTLLEEKIIGAGTSTQPEWTQELDRLERRIAQIDSELGGDVQTQAYRRAVDQLGQWAGNLQQRLDKLEQRIETWIAQEAAERHERQAAVDARFTALEQLIAASGARSTAQIGEIRRIVLVLAALVVALGVVFVLVAVYRL